MRRTGRNPEAPERQPSAGQAATSGGGRREGDPHREGGPVAIAAQALPPSRPPPSVRFQLLAEHSAYVNKFTLSYQCIVIMAHSDMAPDLRFLLESKGVDDTLVNDLAAAGITTISRLSLLADTRASMREALETTFKLDPAQGNNRLRQVCVLDAWETACANSAETRRQQAEASPTASPGSCHWRTTCRCAGAPSWCMAS